MDDLRETCADCGLVADLCCCEIDRQMAADAEEADAWFAARRASLVAAAAEAVETFGDDVLETVQAMQRAEFARGCHALDFNAGEEH